MEIANGYINLAMKLFSRLGNVFVEYANLKQLSRMLMHASFPSKT